MSPHVLVVYGTKFGQTARVAARIQQVLTRHGVAVTLERGDALPSTLRLAEFDGVLVGASMIRGGYQKYIRAFVNAHRAELNAMPSAFFAVSGAAGSANASERAEAQRLARKFCQDSNWYPDVVEPIAGAIAYTKYNFLLRFFMKRISRKEGGSTDTSRDHEYTDWAQVAAFAERFADSVMAEAEAGAAAH